MMKRTIGILLAAALGLSCVLSACGRKTAEGTQESVSYSDQKATSTLRDAVAKELGNAYWPNMEMPADYLESMCGVTSQMYEEYTAEMPMISANVDTMVIVKAKEGMENTVYEALEGYRSYLVEEAAQYPANIGKTQAAKVEAFGRYICFVQLGGDITEYLEQGDEAVIKKCREANDTALQIIRQQLSE